MGNVIPSGNLERNIVKPLGDGLDGVRKCAHLSDVTAGVQVMAAHIGRHPSESPRIVKRSGQSFRFLEIPPDRRELVQREQGLAKVETEIDRALDLLARVGQWVQDRQHLLEERRRLAVPSSYSSDRARAAPQVFVMQSTDARHLHHPALARQLHTPGSRRVLSEG